MAAVAQQYYEEAAQNEQMGEEDEGVSKILVVAHHDERSRGIAFVHKPLTGGALPEYFLLVIYWGQ